MMASLFLQTSFKTSVYAMTSLWEEGVWEEEKISFWILNQLILAPKCWWQHLTHPPHFLLATIMLTCLLIAFQGLHPDMIL